MSDDNMTSNGEAERIAAHRKMKARRRNRNRKKKIVMLAAEIVLLLVVVLCVILLNGLDKMIVKVDPSAFDVESSSEATQGTVIETNEAGETVVVSINETTATIEAEETTEPEETGQVYEFSGEGFNQRYTTIAVFGMDGRESTNAYDTGSNSDVIIIISIDNETGEIRMSSIYRDCAMKLGGTDVVYFNKANYAICAYGIVTAIKTLNLNLDLDIDYFVCVDWEASIELIDAIGGVDITLEEKFFWTTDSDGNKVPYYNGLLSEIVEDTGIDAEAIPEEYFNGTVWHATGAQAVAYMRLRYSDSDIYRTKRQREVIDQVIAKAKNVDFAQLIKIWNVVSNSVKMNISESDILALLQNISKYNFSASEGSQGYPITFYDGAAYPKTSTTHASQWMIIPLNVIENVTQLHSFLYPDLEYSPSSSLQTLDEQMRDYALYDSNWEPLFDQ